MRRRGRPVSRHHSSARWLPLLVGTAALGAVGFSVLAPSADAHDASTENRQAALVLAEDSSALATSARGASAHALAEARVQTLAAAAAQEAAQEAAQQAQAPAS